MLVTLRGASWGILCFGAYETASKVVCACRFAASCIITVEALVINQGPVCVQGETMQPQALIHLVLSRESETSS